MKISISEIELWCFVWRNYVCRCLKSISNIQLYCFCDAWSIFDHVRISRIFTRALLEPFIKSFNLLTSAEASWLFQNLFEGSIDRQAFRECWRNSSDELSASFQILQIDICNVCCITKNLYNIQYEYSETVLSKKNC